ncbi:MAG: transglutaminase family protein, partial [Pseudomonadota bacterium]
MRLSITHRTRYRYDPAASRLALRLKLRPRDNPAQTVRHWSVTVNDAAPMAEIVNGFGDAESVWTSQIPLVEVEVLAKGVVDTKDVSGVLRGQKQEARPALFLRGTDLTQPDEAIRDLAATAVTEKTGLEAAHALANAVTEAVTYRQGVTDAATTASDALKLGAGVCQDHAHVLIAAARSQGAAARYVVGYLYVGDGEEAEFPDATASHAWAEIWVDGLGWVGFDPSNGICPTERYVRLACGLDAPDAAPL